MLVTGPMAPLTLNSRDVNTSSVPPKAISILPPSSGTSGSKVLNTRRKLSLNTDCPNESPSTMWPPVASTSSPISRIPTWSSEHANRSTTCIAGADCAAAPAPAFVPPLLLRPA